MNVVFFVFIFSLISCLQALPSRRARCAVECYLKCITSGTPKAVYCNCPIRDNVSECNSITDELVKSKITAVVPAVETVYKDVRTIMVRLIEPYPSAFIYIFEYSAVSIETEQWIFAGASSSPQITFTIPDSCRDYQFRVLTVLRSTDPKNQFIVFRPRSIPVELPAFTISQDMIHLDPPRQSSDEQSLHVFVSWQNPHGYFDSDIYGYESPVAYPIRCMVPEGFLSQPRVEIVQDGARMHLNLPIEVLEEKCRIFLEVRMIPRCVRLDPFDVQASVELDCQKFPMLNYCKKEMTPQCAEVVDVWGTSEGKASVVWQPPVPNREPLYYQISHGVTRSQGAFPFVTRKIVQHKETRVPGNLTRFEMAAQPGLQYGIQICAVFSERQSTNPFNIVPVIPFTCKACGSSANPNCIECSKVEDAESMVPVECLNQSCATNNLTTHFISMNTAKLDVTDPKKENTVINSNSINPLQRHSKIISTNQAIPVNSDFEEPPFQTNGTLDLLFGVTTDASVSPEESTSETATTTIGPEEETTVELTTVDRVAESEVTTTAFEDVTTEPTTTESPSTSTTPVISSSTTATKKASTQEPFKGDVRVMPVTPPDEETMTSSTEIETVTAERITSQPSTRASSIEYKTSRPSSPRHKVEGVRLHPITKSSKPCKQRNGIVCEFGCLDSLRCDCPKTEKSCIRGIHCPFVKDLRAVYENSTRTLKLYSKQISSVLKNATLYDKIYLEFGEIGPAPTVGAADNTGTRKGDFVFTTQEKERAVISFEVTNVTNLFETIPYIMVVEKPLKVGEVNYGLSVCALNSSLVPVIMDNVLMEQSLFNDNSISSFTQTLLSPIDLNETNHERSEAAKRSLFLVITPILIIFITIIFITTFLCVNIIRDRRLTPSEKFRRRGILRDQSSTHFTGFRPNLGGTNANIASIGITPSSSGTSGDDGPISRSFFNPKNVHF